MRRSVWVWWPIALAATACSVLPFGGGGAPTQEARGGPRQQPAIPVTVAPVERADVAVRLEYPGNVVAKSRVNLVPKIAGRIDRLTVDVGSQVRAGDVIAELDSGVLEAQVHQAEAGLAVAEAKLALILAGSRNEEIAIARAQLKAAQARYDQVRAGATSDVMAAAEAAVQQAEASLRASEVRLDDLRKGADSAVIRAAQAAVEAARASLRGGEAKAVQTQTKVTTLRDFQLASDLVSAETGVVAADASLRAAEEKLADLKSRPKPEDVRLAEVGVDKARADLEAADAKLADLKLQPKPNDLAIAEAAVAQARASYDAAQALAEGQREANVGMGRTGVAGYTAGQSEANALGARAAWEKTQADLRKVKEGPSAKDVQEAVSQVDRQRASLVEAETKLKQVLDGTTAAELRAAESTVQAARASLRVAEVRLDDFRRGAKQIDLDAAEAAVQETKAAVEAARASVASSEARYEQVQTLDLVAAETAVDAAKGAAYGARAKLAFLRQGPQDWDVASAEAQVEQNRQQLALRETPNRPEDIRSAEASVQQARAALRAAQVPREEAMLRAPFDAVVTERFLSQGALASATTPVVALIASEVEVIVNVEETNLAQAQAGRSATIISVAYPGVEFAGQVSVVAPAADTKSRTFAVRIAVPRGESRLRDGMFAQVTIRGEQRAKALVVPKDAVVQRDGKFGVFTVSDGAARFVPVQTGLPSGQRVEVREGLREGQPVVVVGQATLNDGDRVTVPEGGQRPSPGGR